jgi:hypothetical protein
MSGRTKPARRRTAMRRITANGIDTQNPWIRAAIASQTEAKMREEAQDRQRIEAEFASQLTTTRLALYSMEHGQDATDMLARLMVVIGTPCEAGAQTESIGRDAPWVRQLHGALRTLQSMCLADYRWDSRYADAIDRAIEVAGEDRTTLPVDNYAKAWIEANGLAHIVWAHQITPESIA